MQSMRFKHELTRWFTGQALPNGNSSMKIWHVGSVQGCHSLRSGPMCLATTRRSINKPSRKCSSLILSPHGPGSQPGGSGPEMDNQSTLGDCSNSKMPFINANWYLELHYSIYDWIK